MKANGWAVYPARVVPARNQVRDLDSAESVQSDDFGGHSGFGPFWVLGSDDRVGSLACFVGFVHRRTSLHSNRRLGVGNHCRKSLPFRDSKGIGKKHTAGQLLCFNSCSTALAEKPTLATAITSCPRLQRNLSVQ